MPNYIERLIPGVGDIAPMNVLMPDNLTLERDKPEGGYRLIIGLPGIGERIDRATLTELQINGTWNAAERRVKENGKFILIQVQPTNNYEHNEVDEAYAWAEKELGTLINWDKVYLTGLSLGGGGTQRYLSLHPDAHLKFAAAAALCPGPNQFFVTEGNYKNIANLKLPLWFIHCADDSTVKPYQSTLKTVSRVRKINQNPLIVTTILNTGGHAAWTMGYGGNPVCSPSTAMSSIKATITQADGVTKVEETFLLFNNPKAGFLEFFESNTRGKAPVKPESISYAPSTPIPTPVPPPPAPIETLLAIGSGSDGTPYGTHVEIFWSADGKTVSSKSIVKAPAGDKINWIYYNKNTNIATIDFAKAANLPIGPKKNVQ
jgi:hypothetical protein